MTDEAGSDGRTARRLDRARPLVTVIGSIGICAVWVAAVAMAEPFAWGTYGSGHDARPYWEAPLSAPYGTSTVGAFGAYLYSPAFLQVIAPLKLLPWQGFMAAWTAILLVAAVALSGRLLLPVVLAVTCIEIWGGNITLLLAAAIVLGFRWPGTWSFVLLTKVTPGIGLLWFAVRREWRALGQVGLATGAIIGISALVAPGLWREWLDVLVANAGTRGTADAIQVPLLVRLPIAALIVTWGARTDRRWTVPVAATLGLPVIWFGSVTLLVAVLPFLPWVQQHVPGPLARLIADGQPPRR